MPQTQASSDSWNKRPQGNFLVGGTEQQRFPWDPEITVKRATGANFQESLGEGSPQQGRRPAVKHKPKAGCSDPHSAHGSRPGPRLQCSGPAGSSHRCWMRRLTRRRRRRRRTLTGLLSRPGVPDWAIVSFFNLATQPALSS